MWNYQIGVFLSYATPVGRTFLDRELYLPKAWLDDGARCQRTGIPAERDMVTKPVLTADLIERTLDAGLKAEWTTVDAVYGQHTGLRRLDGRAWRAHPAGTGTTGERLYASARIRINGPAETDERWLLACSSQKGPTYLAYFICNTVTLIELARVAGVRWAIEETFQTFKGETGLDHYQVRHYTQLVPAPDPHHVIRWSLWQRRHQHRATTKPAATPHKRDWSTRTGDVIEHCNFLDRALLSSALDRTPSAGVLPNRLRRQPELHHLR